MAILLDPAGLVSVNQAFYGSLSQKQIVPQQLFRNSDSTGDGICL